jgi:hypothetical protein
MPRYPAVCPQYINLGSYSRRYYYGSRIGATYARQLPTLVPNFVTSLVCVLLTSIFSPRTKLCELTLHTQRKMAEASAADGKMKDLKISETKKNKKDGNPKTAAKKPQQQKKKVRSAT